MAKLTSETKKYLTRLLEKKQRIEANSMQENQNKEIGELDRERDEYKEEIKAKVKLEIEEHILPVMMQYSKCGVKRIEVSLPESCYRTYGVDFNIHFENYDWLDDPHEEQRREISRSYLTLFANIERKYEKLLNMINLKGEIDEQILHMLIAEKFDVDDIINVLGCNKDENKDN